MEGERQHREEMQQVREELYLEEQEEANRQRDIVSIITNHPFISNSDYKIKLETK